MGFFHYLFIFKLLIYIIFYIKNGTQNRSCARTHENDGDLAQL